MTNILSIWDADHPRTILEFSNEFYSISYGEEGVMWMFYPYDIGIDLSGFVFETYDESDEEIENILFNSTTNNYDLPELDWRNMEDDDDLDWIVEFA